MKLQASDPRERTGPGLHKDVCNDLGLESPSDRKPEGSSRTGWRRWVARPAEAARLRIRPQDGSSRSRKLPAEVDPSFPVRRGARFGIALLHSVREDHVRGPLERSGGPVRSAKAVHLTGLAR